MRRCIYCRDQYTDEEIIDWSEADDNYSTDPLICPDCYDRIINHKDLEDQFDEIMDLPFC